jgi:biopolymer transport protein ExbD
MNFYQKKRRTPVLQIISMIDILIILLIFLVVSTTFKNTKKVPVAAGAAARSVLNVSIPVSEAMNLGTDTTARTSLTVTKEEKCYLADVEVTLADLGDRLKLFKASSPAAKLDLRIDEKVSFGTLIRIWDGLTKGGYKVGDVPARVTRAGTGG